MCKQALIKSIDLAGGQVALAEGIRQRVPGSKVSQAHIWKWLNKAKCEVPPAEFVIPISDTVDWKVSPHVLRPDIYPNPTDAQPFSADIVKKDKA